MLGCADILATHSFLHISHIRARSADWIRSLPGNERLGEQLVHQLENDNVYAAIKAIWTAVGFIADHKISQQAAKLSWQPQTKAEAETRPEGSLSRMLIQLVLPAIKPLLKTDTEAAYQCICCACELTMGLLPKTQPALCHLVASEILSKGDILPCSFLLLRMDILSHCMDTVHHTATQHHQGYDSLLFLRQGGFNVLPGWHLRRSFA